MMKMHTESRTHFKLYKSGKIWLVTGISTAMMIGASALMNDLQVQADVVQQTTTVLIDSATTDSTPSAGTPDTSATNAVSAQATTAVSETDDTPTSAPASSSVITTTPVSTTTVDSQVAVQTTPTSSSSAVPTTVATIQPTSSRAAVTETIDSWMPDKNLQLAVLKNLTTKDNVYNKVQILPTGSTVNDITKEALAQLISLSGDSYNIASIEGLQYATSLIRIYLVPDLNVGHNRGLITDISPLTNLTNLKEVTMFSNQISDITALANKTTLTSVSLSYNQITDVSPLATTGISTNPGGSSVAYQAVSLPGIWLNPNTDSFASSSSIYNLLGDNVSIKPYYADGSGFYQYAMYYKSTATGTNINGQNITWANFSQNLLTNANGVKYGYMTYYWTDQFLNNAGYPYFGWVIQPFYINDTIGNVTVNYVLNETGASIHQPSNITGTLATQYQIDQYSTVQQAYQQLIDQGYYLYRLSGATTGTFSEQAQSATLYFSKTPPTYEFNVHYQTETGRIISPEQTYTGKLDTTWSVDTTAPEGYQYLYAKDAAGNKITDLAGKYSATVGDITLVYALIEGALPTYEPSALHVKYLDQNGNEIKAESLQNSYIGNGYDVTAPDIAGYQLISQTNQQGQLTETDQTVTFIYALIEGEVPTYEPSTLHVKYVDQNGNEIKSENIQNGYVGNGYDVTAPKISGYKLTSQENYQGQLMMADQTVTFTYELIEGETPTYEPSTLHVKYVDQNGNSIKTDTALSGYAGNEYNVDAIDIDGCRLVSQSNYSGTLVAGNQAVSFVYELIAGVLPEPKPTTINVEFVDEQGNKIQADINKSGFVGNGYLINAPEIVGYHYLGLGNGSAALEGQLIDGGTRLILVYAKNAEPTEPTTPSEPTPPTPTTPPDTITETTNLTPVNATAGSNDLKKVTVATADQNNGRTKLPQTDERTGKAEALVGLGMLSMIAGLFGLGKRKKNNG